MAELVYVHDADADGKRIGRRPGFFGIATSKGGKVLPAKQIEAGYRSFVAHAREHADDYFLLPPLGAGTGGYSRRDAGAVIRAVGIPENVLLARTWLVDD